jgi:amidase
LKQHNFNFIIKRTVLMVLAMVLVVTVHTYVPTATAAGKFRFEEMTLQQLQAGYASKQFTSEEVVKAYLDRIAQYEPNYNAFTTMNTKALEEAREIDRRRAAGEPLGKLAGVPIVIKEAVDMAGFPSTMGWAPLSKEKGGIELIPKLDAPVVTRLKAAGAIILGRTNIPAFSSSATSASTSWDGNTYNAFDRKLAPGASSSGTATAVSGNFAMLGIAEETGGSIQNPAAAQGLVGIKPTFGLVPNTGVVPLSGSLRDVIGPHARTVRDAALMLDVIAGYTGDDPKTVASIGNMPRKGFTQKLNTLALKGKRIGLYGPGWRKEKLTKETQRLYDRAVKKLEKEGATVVADPFAGTKFTELIKAYPAIGYGETFVYDMEKYLERLDPNSGAQSLVVDLFNKTGKPWNPGGPLEWLLSWAHANIDEQMLHPGDMPNLDQYVKIRTEYLQIINDVMDKYKLNAIVFPQMSKETPTLDSGMEIGSTTVEEINIAGVPLITVPAGYYNSGAPFGLAFFGKMWSEADLLGMAYDYEQATKYRKAPILVKKQ